MPRFSIQKTKTWIARMKPSGSRDKGLIIAPSETDAPASASAAPSTEDAIPLTSKYLGLAALNNPFAPSLKDNEVQYPVDIIAVHGLNGDTFATWTHNNGNLWLKDFLPGDLPGCRVFTYGYPSQIWSESIAGVRVYAGRLLDSLREIQETDRDKGIRRVIFVCHSLGGIVCKQALVTAHEETSNPLNTTLLRSIAGIVFLGTPHRGSASGSLGSIVGNIINVALGTKVLRTDNLELLKTGSTALQDLSESVRDRLVDLKIVSFFETEPEPIMKIIVGRDSAILAIAGEEIIGLYATHREMCRFPDPNNTEYKRVLGAIKRIATHESDRRMAKHRASTHSFQKTWNDLKPCLSLFSKFDPSNYKAMLPSPAEGTCSWILTNKTFVSWLDKAESALLWLAGHSGCGKTTLSLFLAKQLDNDRSTGSASSVCIFFCDDKVNNQKVANNILIGLIYQLLCRNNGLARHVKASYDTHGADLINSCEALWSLFRTIAADPRSGSVIIIIDALDECENKTRRWLLKEIKDFIRSEDYHAKPSGHRIKFILTSRPSLGEVEKIMDARSDHRIAIDEDHGDVQRFIKERVEEISKQRQFPDDAKKFLLDSLNSRSGQTFLWVRMVLEQIEAADLLSYHELKASLDQIPKSLELTYMGFMAHLNPLDAACRLLKLILGCSRHLTLDEINIAFSIEASHEKVADLKPNLQIHMDRTLRNVLGPLIRISKSKVLLVHQSAKEFILQQAGGNEAVAPEIRSIRAQDCTLAIATACINYLLLAEFSEDVFDLLTSTPDNTSEIDSKSIDKGEIASEAKPSWDEHEEYLNLDALTSEIDFLDDITCEQLTSRYPFYSYAALNWADHFSICENIASDQLKEAAKTLLNPSNISSGNFLRFYSCQITSGVECIPLQRFDFVTLAAFFNVPGLLQDHLASHSGLEKQTISQGSLDDALFWSAERGYPRIVTALLQAGGNPNVRQILTDRLFDQTPLTIASKNGHIDCVRALLADPRTDINLQGTRGRTALSYACHAGHKAIVAMLLSDPKCDPDRADNDISTPLIWAAGGAGDHSAIITLLPKHRASKGVNLNHFDKDGRTAISWAAGEGCIGALKALLKLKDTDPNIPAKNGRSPLSFAAGKGHADAVRILVKDNRVDKVTKSDDGRNPYSWACVEGHAEVVMTLMRYGCPGLDEPDDNGWTPLAWATHSPSPRTTKLLLAASEMGFDAVDIDRGDHVGNTALRWAVNCNHIEVVRALLRAGASPRKENNFGVSVLSKARAESANQEIIRELESAS
ncbi:ankyrin repeat protein [Rhypophila decipiens]|uniref:Ankyrin repeat protein n=1 Tax=Rhypophila decipiens TaxID=261697 RepID=A0AAN7B247_9PEZI|nr:ankyrin repeat protein [Rhypophila decipiens]